MSPRIQPLGLFLLMLWVPPIILLGLRVGGCAPFALDPTRAVLHAPAQEAGNSAADAEGVSLPGDQ